MVDYRLKKPKEENVNRHFTAALIFILSLVNTAWAQEPPPDDKQVKHQVMSSEEAQALREDLRTLARAVSDDAASEKEGSGKTMADVSDRALSMVEGVVARVAATLEDIAPEVWRIMIRQQYAEAFALLVIPWSLFFFTLLYMWQTRKHWLTEKDKGDWDAPPWWFTTVVPTVLMACWAVWGIDNIADASKLLINPEYYAVKDILTMLLDPASLAK